MIELNLVGALGNQMFEYAFARAISLEYGDESIITNKWYLYLVDRTSHMFRYKKLYPLSGYYSQLGIFDLKIKEINPIMGVFRALTVGIQHLMMQRKYVGYDYNIERDKIQELYRENTRQGRFYCPADVGRYFYFGHAHTNKKRKAISGTFQSAKYFEKYSDVIIQELTVNVEPTEENKKLMEAMRTVNSVAVHFRTDWFTTNDTIAKARAICTKAYYEAAMRYIARQVNDPTFYIFSDNIKYVKENINFDYPVRFVDLNNPNYEDLRLMYNCKHFIISNSTFSWWGSYLANNADKIIIAPSIWIRGKVENKNLDIYTDNMIRIDPGKGEVVK